MPIDFLPATKMLLDRGPEPGEHLWVVGELWNFDGGYERAPQWESVSTNTVTAGYLPRGIFTWKGGSTERIYYADDDNLFEISLAGTFTNVSGATYTNDTNGVTFASFGQYALASNGVDKIQILRVPSTTGSTENFSDMQYTTNGAVIAPKYICSHKNHIIAANIKFLSSYGLISTITTPVGGGYTNQPSNGSVQILSSAAGDTSKTVTIYGTTNGTDTLVAEVMTTNGANGTTAVTSSKTDWGKILAVKKQATTGTITVRKTSGAATITTLAPADTSNSVTAVSSSSRGAGSQLIDIVSDGATTKQVGFAGTTYNSSLLYDSQALTGTTTVQSNVSFDTITEVYTGDVENTRTVTITTHLYAAGYEDPYLVWVSGTDNQNGYGDPTYAPAIPGSDRFPLLDGVGKITGVVDGGDAFFVFKEGSVHRFDGPPFHSAVINSQTGMAPRNVPYRQGSRIYYYSAAGFRYVDIYSNEVVSPLEGMAYRSILDSGNVNLGFVMGCFPSPFDATGATIYNAVNTTSVASIFGDPKYDLVWCLYVNASVGGTNGFVLNEKKSEVYLTKGPVVTSQFYGTPVNGTENFPGDSVRLLGPSASTIHRYYSPEVTGLEPQATQPPSFIRWPFTAFDYKGQGRITRVKPVFSTSTLTQRSEVPIVQVDILSVVGTANSWWADSVKSSATSTLYGSKDGWITIPNCPNADRHSIGLSFEELSSGNAITVANFIGMHIEWEQAPAHAR